MDTVILFKRFPYIELKSVPAALDILIYTVIKFNNLG